MPVWFAALYSWREMKKAAYVVISMKPIGGAPGLEAFYHPPPVAQMFVPSSHLMRDFTVISQAIC